ncbi:delta-type opioid receptor-like isoform X2 [Anopheles albimanus]|uniref:G-protein coupled receptors family 1 profile domain-containing protein n=1 Tax=Anopheles albimanus TaxID=7167 RepID=A0A182FBP5_ANOAL|nr:delta-type opioid receptor-like isoform X2 [Anopheles albimanus]
MMDFQQPIPHGTVPFTTDGTNVDAREALLAVLSSHAQALANHTVAGGRMVGSLDDSFLAGLAQQKQYHYVNATVSEAAETGEEYEKIPTCILLPITIFYCFIFVAGIVGNLSICIVIAKNKSMHTATNYYLFNLAVSDFMLLLFGMPQELYATWNPLAYPFNQVACIITGLMSETAANATVLTITTFTVERYIAICHPFRSHTMSKLSRAVRFVIVIWLVAFGLATPQALQFGIVESPGSRLCTIKNRHFNHAFEVSGALFFVGPMTLIAVLYVLIGIKLRKSKLLQGVKRASTDYAARSRGVSAQTRVIRMLVAVVAMFFICWAPFHAQRLMAVYSANTDSIYFYKIYTILNFISGILYFLSTCINPLLYNIMSHKFRDASRHTLKVTCCGGSRRFDGHHHTYSAVSRYGVTGAGSFKFNSNNMTCIGAGINMGTAAAVGQGAITGLAATASVAPTTDQHSDLCHQESDMSLLPNDQRHRGTPGRFVRSNMHCVSISSSQSTTGTNLSSNGKLNRSNGSLRQDCRTTPLPASTIVNDGETTGRLSTIAEKLRRGTKKVLAFSKSPVSTPGKSPSASVTDERRKEYRKRHSCDSVDTNTISNSSLKEFDEDEFSSAELARFMAEVNSEIR